MVSLDALDAEDALEGQRLGRYELVRRLAHGGMATVYLAHQSGPQGFERKVAVKVIHSHLRREPKFVTMLMDEAQLSARLQHPNVCSVVELCESEGHLLLVLEYLQGETLLALLKRVYREGGIPPALTARVICDAARGLHAAHELRDDAGQRLDVVHRDVTPSNIMVLYDGHTKLMDFGVARARGRITESTTGELKGKLSYMSPEQLDGRGIDRRSDVWSLGVCLHEALTGTRLFRAANEGATAVRILQKPIKDPRELRPDVPEPLAVLAMQALERDLDKRLPDAEAIADACERFLYSRGEPLGPPWVAAWMASHFDGPKEGALALEVDSGSSLPGPVAPPPPPAETLPEVMTPIGPAPEETISQGGAEPPVSRRAILGLVGGIVAGGTLLGVGAALWPGDDRRPVERLPEPVDLPPDPSVVTTPAPVDAVPVRPPVTPTAEPPTPERLPDPPPTAEPPTPERPPDPPPTTEPRPPRRVENGRLNLLAIPAADVFLRGRRIGRTPVLEHALPAGFHVLDLRQVDGPGRRRVRVRIRPRALTSQTVRFEP